MIELPHLQARVRRLDDLSGRLLREVEAMGQAASPLLPSERQDYCDALYVAVTALDDARSSPSRALLRIEGRAA